MKMDFTRWNFKFHTIRYVNLNEKTEEIFPESWNSRKDEVRKNEKILAFRKLSKTFHDFIPFSKFAILQVGSTILRKLPKNIDNLARILPIFTWYRRIIVILSPCFLIFPLSFPTEISHTNFSLPFAHQPYIGSASNFGKRVPRLQLFTTLFFPPVIEFLEFCWEMVVSNLIWPT